MGFFGNKINQLNSWGLAEMKMKVISKQMLQKLNTSTKIISCAIPSRVEIYLHLVIDDAMANLLISM